MLSFLQRYFRGILLLLFGLLGLALGHLAAAGLGIYLSPPIRLPEVQSAQRQAAPRAALSDYETILQRNIFDSTAAGAQPLAPVEKTVAAGPATETTRTDLTLFGTVAAGADSLALIRADKETLIYHLDDEVSGGGRITDIERNQVRIKNPDGTEQVLPLHEGEETRAKPTRSTRRSRAAASNSNIKSVGENRWVIPREEIEKARGNLNELLRQARMEPQIVNGKTEGFIVRMIQRNSLLANLGIRRGDVVMNVNGVELDSPEKALQIFQQLREAKNISIGLTRGGKPMNFEYEIN